MAERTNWQESLQLLRQLSVTIEDFAITVGCSDATVATCHGTELELDGFYERERERQNQGGRVVFFLHS